MAGQVKIPEPNIVDKVVGFFNPIRGIERLKARTQMAIAGQWVGARFDRRQTAGWVPFGGSADADTVADLRWLRNRSRDTQRNQPLALGAINTVVTTAVGTGLVLRSTIDASTLGMSTNDAQEWQRKTEREFRLWAGSASACDATRTNDFYQIQGLAFRSALESGDVFASLPMIKRRGQFYQTKLQLIEADRVQNKDYAMNTEDTCLGVECDKYGAPVNYHIMRRHPGGLLPMNLEWDIVPAFGSRTGRRNIIHLFDKRRPGQSRGVPYLAPVIEMLKQLSDYSNAEVTAAVVSSMFTVFVTTANGQGLDTGMADPATDQKPGGTLTMGPGAVLDLAPGEDVKFADPKRPSAAFDPFVLSVLRQIGVALELPFEILVKHFTASYSAARAAMLEAWRFYKGRRAWMAAQFCQPTYEAWLEEAIALGRIDAPGFFDNPTIRAAYVGAEWIGDAPGQLDPLKEVNAAKGRLELNLTSHSDECVALNGADWDATIERRAREEQRLQELGLQTIYAPLAPANLNGPAPQVAPAKPGGDGAADAPEDDDAGDLESA